MRFMPIRAFLTGSLLAISNPAHAVDGVLEISQTCAVNTGCFAGDTAGFPVMISVSGSYRLTSNLTVPDENTTAISISAADVTLDLNGFAIIGPTVCTGTPVISCTPSGIGRGVSSTSLNTTVTNGTVRGMGGIGINVASGGSKAQITKVRAFSNGDFGIRASSRSTIVGNVAMSNGNTGIFGGAGSNVTGNNANANAGRGIEVAYGSTVTRNTATENGGDGIRATVGSAVIGNTVRDNAGFGLSLGENVTGRVGYANNVITNNTGGTVFAGTEMGTNICDLSTTCP